jgi:hypothetical protein
MAGSTFYGTTLTDLQGGRTAQDRMDAERQQLAQRLFAQAAQGMAERMAAQQKAQQDREYQRYALEQQDRQAAADRGLRGQQLTMQGQAEIERQKAEQARTAAILEAERIRNQGISIQYPQGRLDPKMMEQIQKQNDAAAQSNAIAEAAAREANALLSQTVRGATDVAVDAGKPLTNNDEFHWYKPWGWSLPSTTAKNDATAQKAIGNTYRDTLAKSVDAIRLKLGDKAQYLNFNGRSFEPLKLPIHELPSRQSFPGTEVPSAGGFDTDLSGRVGVDVPVVNRVFPGTAPVIHAVPAGTNQFQLINPAINQPPARNAVPNFRFDSNGNLIPIKVGAIDEAPEDPYSDIQRRNQYFASLY